MSVFVLLMTIKFQHPPTVDQQESCKAISHVMLVSSCQLVLRLLVVIAIMADYRQSPHRTLQGQEDSHYSWCVECSPLSGCHWTPVCVPPEGKSNCRG